MSEKAVAKMYRKCICMRLGCFLFIHDMLQYAYSLVYRARLYTYFFLFKKKTISFWTIIIKFSTLVNKGIMALCRLQMNKK